MARRPLVPLAGACALLAAIVYAAAVHVPAVERADLHTLAGFTGLSGPRTEGAAWVLADAFNLVPFALLAAAVVTVGLVRRRPGLAAGAAVAMLGANITTQVLKPALAVARPQVDGSHISAAAWPSGHATAAMSVALALVLVAPARLRPLVAAAAGLVAVGNAYAILLLGWHYPSDVVGGFLIAAAWSCGAAAMTSRPVAALRGAALVRPVGAALASLAAAGLLVALARPARVADYAAQNTTFVAGALVLAAGAVAIAAVAALAFSGSGPAPRAARRRPLTGWPRARG